MSNKRGPRTPRVWTDRWIRKQETHWRPRRHYGDEEEIPDARPEPAQAMWKRVSRHNAQRAQKGYSVYDWWSFDTFICGVIANACRDFRLKGVSYAMGYTEGSWSAYLLSIETPLRVWAEGKYDLGHGEEVEAYEAAKAAMHRFADELGNFWD